MPLFPGKPRQLGRAQVYGCSPGCLMLSIGLSILLTILLNLLVRAF